MTDAGPDSAAPLPDAGDGGGDVDPDGSVIDPDASYAADTSALAPLAGPHQRRAPGQENLAFHGTDLGYTVHHGGELRIVFGDTHVSEVRAYIANDDAFGTLAFDQCPAGDEVTRFAQDSAAEDAPWWERAAPELAFATSEPDQLAYVHLVEDGDQLRLGPLQTPISFVSDGADRLIGVFQRSDPAKCSADDRGECPDDLECDTGLGTCPGIFPVPCVLGATTVEEGACRTGMCADMGGHCRDPNSSIDDGSATGRIASVAQRLLVGAEADQGGSEFVSTPWVTNKLMNSFARAVRDFDEARPNGQGNDYRAPDGTQLDRARILVWGRPSYIGSKAEGRQAQVYLALAELPELNGDGAPSRWQPRYFAGLDDDGAPRFIAEQRDAVPLDLSGGEDDPSEPHDIINQMAVSWVEPIGRWVMLYGGDLDPGTAEAYNPGYQRNDEGAIFVRFATQPWGPWSKPEPLLRAGDPANPGAAGSQYAPGGVLYHPECEGEGCIPGDADSLYPPEFEKYGWLYGPNIVECWTTAQDGGADLYWNVSTWNPYQVVLMKTRLRVR